MKTTRFLVVPALLFALVVSVAACGGGDDKSSDTTAKKSTPTSVNDGSKPIIAQEPPKDKPQEVAASGKCKEALDSVRKVISSFPSGTVMDQAGMDAANKGVNQAQTDCEKDVYQAFLDTEYKPWLNYAVPEDYPTTTVAG
jgi:hypothetical protein